MPEVSAGKYLVNASWDDVPHLDANSKAEIAAGSSDHLREARSLGTPSLGAGAIFPLPLDEILVDPFEIPEYWPRVYGLDVGWNRTAAIWGAWDTQAGILYLYTEHYRAHAEPSIHVAAIKARGEWMQGVIDPAGRSSSQVDGKQLFIEYQEMGLNLYVAGNSIDAGILKTWDLMATGRLRVLRHLKNWQAEYKLYRRDKEGKIIKKFDHLMDATRYLVVSGKDAARCRPSPLAHVDTGLTVGVLSKAGY
jgi:hypothetical protein